MGYNPRDFYFKKAKSENYAARSIYKLKEIDEKYKLLRGGQRVLDLGCAPGSWSQYASERAGDRGLVVGVDLQPVKVNLSNFIFAQVDLFDLVSGLKTQNSAETPSPELEQIRQQFVEPFDFVMSDMAPKTSGIKSSDQAKSTALCELAIDVADRYLKKGGNFVCKFFHSGDFGLMKKALNQRYVRVEVVKPDATREISKEIFFVGLIKK